MSQTGQALLRRQADDFVVDASTPEALQSAFRAFNELSRELSDNYHALELRVRELTQEAARANAQRLQELSEKERLASRLENLLQLLPGGVLVLNSEGRVAECNKAAVELLGEPLAGELWLDVIQQRFSPRADDGHEISLRDGRRVSLLTRSLNDEPGQIILITDQTETRRLQQNLSRHQRLSEMGRMVSSLAHQIRTPLSAAMLYSGHLASHKLSDEQYRRTVNKLENRLHNMERQVQDMLLFARGDAVLDTVTGINALLEETRSAAEVLMRGPNIRCHWGHVADDMQVRCNRDALIGALLNLIENAVQSAGAAAVLHIEGVLVQEQGRTMVRLQVSDNGPGVAPEIMDQVTEAFFTTKAQGTGLGLAVAQIVARAHGGRFFIESNEHKVDPEADMPTGTCAGFLLPVIELEKTGSDG